jgi:hypothetical protein
MYTIVFSPGWRAIKSSFGNSNELMLEKICDISDQFAKKGFRPLYDKIVFFAWKIREVS